MTFCLTDKMCESSMRILLRTLMSIGKLVNASINLTLFSNEFTRTTQANDHVLFIVVYILCFSSLDNNPTYGKKLMLKDKCDLSISKHVRCVHNYGILF